MGWLDRIRRQWSAAPDVTVEPVQDAVASSEEGPADDHAQGPRWYVPVDGDMRRFAGADGLPSLHLIPYTDAGYEHVWRLCEDSTGLLVGPTDRRLRHAGVWSVQCRGEFYHQDACRDGDFRPGSPVRLRREPENVHGSSAIAVTADEEGAPVAAYVNKGLARSLAKLLDRGDDLRAVSVRGTGPGRACEQIGVVIASPAVLRRLTEPRPTHLPTPAHLR